jgi:hypothetical protein
VGFADGMAVGEAGCDVAVGGGVTRAAGVGEATEVGRGGMDSPVPVTAAGLDDEPAEGSEQASASSATMVLATAKVAACPTRILSISRERAPVTEHRPRSCPVDG